MCGNPIEPDVFGNEHGVGHGHVGAVVVSHGRWDMHMECKERFLKERPNLRGRASAIMLGNIA